MASALAVQQQPQLITVEEYLEFERQSKVRHEYLDGHLYVMAGESPEHADICSNLLALLYAQVDDGPCRVRSKDSKVRSGPMLIPRSTKGLFSYPDLVVICGEPEYLPEYLDDRRDVLTNPTLIIEVMSESTAFFDRHEKFIRYQLYNPTLIEYVLVRQDMPAVEVFARQSDGSWRYTPQLDLSQTATLSSINCTLPLARVYRRVTFSVKKPVPKKAKNARAATKPSNPRSKK